MENRIYFLDKSKDFELAHKLYELVVGEFTINRKIAVFGKSCDSKENFDVFVCEFGADTSAFSEVCTYSVGQSNADVCGFNFQKREKSKSLDLFCGNSMGRVNLPLDSRFTEISVLYCTAGLVAAGIPLPQILKAINSKLS
ncbi:MAG: hypothetical protein IKK10_03495 [Clostridia bacterium]|nr:hypothetical protein [Clostridia bacterium]